MTAPPWQAPASGPSSVLIDRGPRSCLASRLPLSIVLFLRLLGFFFLDSELGDGSNIAETNRRLLCARLHLITTVCRIPAGWNR